jgi:hypothetical protein
MLANGGIHKESLSHFSMALRMLSGHEGYWQVSAGKHVVWVGVCVHVVAFASLTVYSMLEVTCACVQVCESDSVLYVGSH